MRHSNGSPPLSRYALLAAAASVLLTAGCATKDPATTGSIGKSTNNPVQQASALRAQGRAEDAVKLMRGALTRTPRSKELMLASARALADAGQNDEALLAFAKAQDPRRPDWRIMNAEGAVLDRLGRTMDAQQRYQAEQAHYRAVVAEAEQRVEQASAQAHAASTWNWQKKGSRRPRPATTAPHGSSFPG